MTKNPHKHTNGFTLTEILIALSITGIILAVVYAFYITQSKTYTKYNQGIELQQGLRISMLSIERELRQAGYNPGGLGKTGAGIDGVDNNCNGTTDEPDNALTPMVDESEAIGLKVAQPGTIIFSMDKDGNGLTCDDRERVTFTLNGTTLERNGMPKMENVDVLDFVYLNKNGAIASTVDDIRSVQITIIGRTNSEEPGHSDIKSYLNLQGAEILAPPSDGFHRRTLSSQIYMRNLTD